MTLTFDFYVSDTRTPEPYKEIIHKIYSIMKKVLFFMLTILLADVTYSMVDPRIRIAGEKGGEA